VVWVNVMVRYISLSLNRLSSEDHLIGAAEDVLSCIRETNEHVKEARNLRPPLEAEDDYTLAESKMRRALDRLKRTATKVIDGPDDVRSSGDGIVKAVKSLLMNIATTMEALLSPVGTVGDLVASVLLILLLACLAICIRRLRLIA
jgi:hypothetical protein